MTTTQKVHRVSLIFLLGVILFFLYVLLTYKHPIVTFTNKLELNQLSDTNCKLNLYLQIKNENIFSLKANDFFMKLGNGITGTLENSMLNIPRSSDSIYKLEVNLKFISISSLLNPEDTQKAKTNVSQISFKCKIGFLPFYISINRTLKDTGRQEVTTKLISEIIGKNIELIRINKPKTISLKKLQIDMDFKIINPYSISLIIKNYRIQMKEPSYPNPSLGGMASDSELILSPKTAQIVKGSFQINPVTTVISSFLKYFTKNGDY